MEERDIRPEPSTLKADVWKYFGFDEVEGKKDLDKSHTICKLSKTKLIYFGNTTNMRNHTEHLHPEAQEKQPVVAATANQRTIEQVASKFPLNSEPLLQRIVPVFSCWEPGVSLYVTEFGATIQHCCSVLTQELSTQYLSTFALPHIISLWLIL